MICLATQFGHPGDGYGGRTPTVLTKKPVTANDIGIAHRTWPMGKKIAVTNLSNGKRVIAVVIDRGPWGMRDSKGWFNSRRERPRGAKLIKQVGEMQAYRGCADLTPRLVRLLGHNKKEPVMIRLL